MKPIYTILLTALGGIVLGAVGFMAVDYFTKDQNQRTPVTSLPGATTTVMVDSVATPPPPTYKSPDLQMELAKGDVRKIEINDGDYTRTLRYNPEGLLVESSSFSSEEYRIHRNKKGQISSITWPSYEFDMEECGEEYKYNQDGFLIEESGSYGVGSSTIKYTYNKNDELIKSIDELWSEGMCDKYTNTYSNYLYDQTGNWISRKVKQIYQSYDDVHLMSTETSTYTETRVITYY